VRILQVDQLLQALNRYVRLSGENLTKLRGWLDDILHSRVARESKQHPAYNPEQHSEFLDNADNLPGNGRQPLAIYIAENLDEIANFRKRNNLPEYKASDAQTGTVARVSLQEKTFYGVNSGFNRLYTLSLEERRALFNTLKQKGKLIDLKTGQQLSNLSEAQFLSHAEAEALIKAKKAGIVFPKEIDLFVDRPTCPNCKSYLKDLMNEYGIDKMNIYWKNASNPPFIIK